MTRRVTLFKLVTFPLLRVNMSIILPGVQITNYAPCLKSDNCPCTPSPPYTAITLIPRALQNTFAYKYTCLANYLVGVIIIDIGPSPSSTFF